MFHPYYLNCYRFNADGNRNVLLAGAQNALTMQLFVDFLTTNLTIPKGVYVFVQNATQDPFVIDSPLDFQVGMGANIVVNRLFSSQHQSPYSDCTVLEDNTLSDAGASLSDTELVNAVLNTSYDYSRLNCFSYCKQLLNVAHCGCLDMSVNYQIGNKSFCLNERQLECLNAQTITFYTRNNIDAQCLPRCPLNCMQRLMSTAVVTYSYPSYSLKFLGSGLSTTYTNLTTKRLDYVAANIVEMSIYYDHLAFTQIKEEPKMTFDDMIGIFGGHMHLFLGMSLMSFVEIIELIVISLCYTCKQIF